ncbi:branched-chain amino acid ABC transporter permease [Pseudohalocynthiibacter sp. F2068]|uniref:branched-chain amino acid ABC transporter permease n=1 Tax=Pseudohalocynthiibacter sp. F2068 TaxID=2926418 RepID=UPI001FF4FBB5|nr:branched-chain amino acid ABC transporter permease [Pseudohalocynthiibacter sp. F2068]MCK0103242.1 branched-chain amino acid ABC transporter permease [Pseudohalocynthiibacter sp. F2068]
MSSYLISVLTLVGIQSFMALSAYLLLITGQISFGQQAYFGIGAYFGGAMTSMFGWNLATAILVSCIAAGAAGAFVGYLTLRLGGLYFAIATLAFAEMTRLIWVNLFWQVEVDNISVGPQGPEGFRDIRYVLDNEWSAEAYLLVVVAILVSILLLFMFLERSFFGLRLRMIAGRPEIASAMGVNPLTYRIAVSGVAAGIAGLGGVLFAHFMTFLDPMNFGVMLGVHSLAYGLIGGLGSALGPLIGVGIDIGLLETLRIFSGYRMIVFGSLVALILIVRPRGLLDERTLRSVSKRASKVYQSVARQVWRGRT